MEFNNFYKLMRKSPQYDKILESKENDFMLRLLTSREVFAIFYSNDLYDNKYTLCQILKLYNNTKLKRLVKDSLMERIKAQHKKKLVVVWAEAGRCLNVTNIYNEQYVNDLNYFNDYHPVRSLMRTEVS